MPPPSGGYVPPPGGYNPPPPQYGGGTGIDDRSWNLINHFGGAAGAFVTGGFAGWVAPLIVMLTQGNRSPYLRSEALKALNFQGAVAVVTVVGWVTCFVGVGAIITTAAWLVGTIIGIIAGIKANNNEPYNYPLNIQVIK